jgi:hypothetical protein
MRTPPPTPPTNQDDIANVIRASTHKNSLKNILNIETITFEIKIFFGDFQYGHELFIGFVQFVKEDQ